MIEIAKRNSVEMIQRISSYHRFLTHPFSKRNYWMRMQLDIYPDCIHVFSFRLNWKWMGVRAWMFIAQPASITTCYVT